jgi:hypothetical protein
MRLDILGAGSRMGQVKDGAHTSDGSTVRHHLSGAANIATNTMPHHLLIVSASAMP